MMCKCEINFEQDNKMSTRRFRTKFTVTSVFCDLSKFDTESVTFTLFDDYLKNVYTPQN